MFDNATTLMFSAAPGLTKYQLFEQLRVAPAIRWSIRARAFSFRAASATTSTIETTMTEIKRSSFQITHHLKKDGALAVEAFETRVWTGRDPADRQDRPRSGLSRSRPK